MADYPLCLFCKERNTKYRCVTCDSSVCNVCSTEVTPETKGYDEEFKKVGQCKDCKKSEIKKMGSTESNVEPPKKLQKTLFNMFGGKHLVTKKETTLSSNTKNNPKQFKKTTTTTTSRTVTPATLEKWKSELADYFVSDWLDYTVDSNGKVKHMKCKFCTKFENAIKTIPNYSNIFVMGSTNFKKSAVEDHAKNSKHHTKACQLHFESKCIPADERAKVLAKVKGNTDILSGIASMDRKDVEKTKQKV